MRSEIVKWLNEGDNPGRRYREKKRGLGRNLEDPQNLESGREGNSN